MKTMLTLINQVPRTTAEFYIQQGPSEFQTLFVAGDGGTATQTTDPSYGSWQIYAQVGGNTSRVIKTTDPDAVITCTLVNGLPEIALSPSQSDAGGKIEAPGPSRSLGAASRRESASDQDIRDYWTVARKNNAIPKLRRGHIAPDLLEKTRKGQRERAQVPTAGSTTTLVPSMTVPPYAAVGKLFFHWDGADYVGTAWVINTTTVGIFTAGHNLFEKGEWSTKVLFDLQYSNGAFAAQYTGKNLYVAAQWEASEDYAYDLAVVGPSAPIAQGTKALDYLMDTQMAKSYRGIGYPARPLPGYAFDGKYMWESVGDSIAAASGSFSAYDNMTAGSSGGPWCVVVDSKWYANGLQSHGLDDDEVSYSPIFTAAKINPLLKAAGLIPNTEDQTDPRHCRT